jgi:hypothetical protein
MNETVEIGSRAQSAIKVRGNLSLRERAGVRGRSADNTVATEYRL